MECLIKNHVLSKQKWKSASKQNDQTKKELQKYCFGTVNIKTTGGWSLVPDPRNYFDTIPTTNTCSVRVGFFTHQYLIQQENKTFKFLINMTKQR